MACRKKRRFNANGEPEAAAVGVYGTPEQKTIEQKKKKKLKKRDRKVVRAAEDIVGHDWSRAAKNKYLAAQSTVPEYLLAGPLVVNIKGTTPILPRDELRLLAPLPLVQEPFRAPGVRAGARSGCEGIWQVTCRTSPRRPRELESLFVGIKATKRKLGRAGQLQERFSLHRQTVPDSTGESEAFSTCFCNRYCTVLFCSGGTLHAQAFRGIRRQPVLCGMH